MDLKHDVLTICFLHDMTSMTAVSHNSDEYIHQTGDISEPPYIKFPEKSELQTFPQGVSSSSFSLHVRLF